MLLLSQHIDSNRFAANRPDRITGTAVVQFGGTFLVVSGWNGSSRLNTVLRYTEAGTWETLPVTVSTVRTQHSAVATSDC